ANIACHLDVDSRRRLLPKSNGGPKVINTLPIHWRSSLSAYAAPNGTASMRQSNYAFVAKGITKAIAGGWADAPKAKS
ncbi:hypothetical protein, partial [Aphanothece microscopica]|uniref:hypothetical protein n=1 Tax=Aphanothece microscopica TaxID=1049561 RepID=UPI003984B248